MSYVEDTSENTSSEQSDSYNDSLGVEVVYRRKRRRRSGWFKKLRKRFLGTRMRWNAASMLLGVLIIIVVAAAVVAFDSFNRVQTSIQDLQRVVALLGSKAGTELTLNDFDRLRVSVDATDSTLDDANKRLGFLQPFRSLNANLDTALDALNAAHELSSAAKQMLAGLQPTLFYMVQGEETEAVMTQASSGQRIIELLTVGQSGFVAANTHLQNAEVIIAELSPANIDPSLVGYIQDLTIYRDQLNEINNLLLEAPDFLETALGIDRERSYLVLSQNNDEIRPSGGYLSTWGWMTVRNGRVTEYDYSPTTVDSPTPPPPEMAAEVQVPDWWIRYGQPLYAAWDGSWYADFPSTANMAMWYYNSGENLHAPVDGVISIDITGFEYLIEAIGSVYVPEYDRTVDAHNFRSVVYEIRVEGHSNDHKEFLSALYRQMFTKWQSASLDPAENQAVLGALLRAIQEKHVMMYFANESLNHAVELLGWTGRQLDGVGHDYLLIADANLGNKSNNSVLRSVTYDVDIQTDGTVLGRATINYDFSSRVAAEDPAVNPPYNGTRDYYTLTQLFVPAGTELTTTDNVGIMPTVVEQETHTLIVSQFAVPFDTSQRFQFNYHTSQVVESLGELQRYRLLLQKQPGARTNIVNVQIMLPQDMELDSSNIAPATTYTIGRQIIEFRVSLNADQWIEVIFSAEDD